MTTVYSTCKIHPRDRLNYWVEVASKAFARHSFSAFDGTGFLATVRTDHFDEVGVASFESVACEVVRSARDVAHSENDPVLLSLQVAGEGRFAQDDRQAVSEAGSFLLLDSRRPFSISFPGRARAIGFKLPRQRLEARLGNLAGLIARPITAHKSVGGLPSKFLSMLPSRVGALDEATGGRLAEQALDLIALAFSEMDGGSGTVLCSPRATTLYRLKCVIEARLCHPDLKPAAAAAAAGISVRYANALLSQEGSSIERYILYRRLERCRRALEDAAQAHRMIGEIAFAWGFSDLSHFVRRFRAAYGMTPGDCRRQAQEGACDAHDGRANAGSSTPKVISKARMT